jgi:hypothetical protein
MIEHMFGSVASAATEKSGGTSELPAAELETAPTEWIEREIGELAAHIAAATCRWLELVVEFDRRNGHEVWGFHSCGAWVAWRCSIDPRSAREHVRVARALLEFPAVREKFRRGELSYSKVRAITRIATPEIEAELVEMSRFATAAQLERLVRGYRRAVSLESTVAAHQDRFLSTEWDEDGSLCIRGRLAPEEGAVFLKALEAGREAIRRDMAEHQDEAAQGGSAEPAHGTSTDFIQGDSAEPEPPRRVNDADALMQVAEGALTGDLDVRSGGDRYQVVVHADADALVGEEGEGRCRLDAGPAIPAETARRLSCDASLVSLLHGPRGSLDVGRKTRSIPPSMRRALQARDDACCQFPGCINRRWVDAHHIHHWAKGGETKLDNLILLCTHHHRLVHEGGFSVLRQGDGRLVFRCPDGKVIPPHPSPTRGGCGELRARNRRTGLRIGPKSSLPLGFGERMDRELVVTGLLARAGP